MFSEWSWKYNDLDRVPLLWSKAEMLSHHHSRNDLKHVRYITWPTASIQLINWTMQDKNFCSFIIAGMHGCCARTHEALHGILRYYQELAKLTCCAVNMISFGSCPKVYYISVSSVLLREFSFKALHLRSSLHTKHACRRYLCSLLPVKRWQMVIRGRRTTFSLHDKMS